MSTNLGQIRLAGACGKCNSMTCRLQQLSEERGDSRRKLLLLTSSRCFPAGVAAERLEGKVECADANSLSSRPTQRLRNKRAVTSNSDDNGKKNKKKFHSTMFWRCGKRQSGQLARRLITIYRIWFHFFFPQLCFLNNFQSGCMPLCYVKKQPVDTWLHILCFFFLTIPLH